MASGLASKGMSLTPSKAEPFPRWTAGWWESMPSAVFLTFDVVLFLGAVFFGFSSTTAAATRRLLLSSITVVTISVTICFSSSKNCRASYLCCSISRSFFSQIPVSSALFNKSSWMRPMSSIPVGVGSRLLRIFLI